MQANELMAQSRHADLTAQCPLSGEERKTSARREYSGFDPADSAAVLSIVVLPPINLPV
jgi:hypothetical protein